MGIPTIIPIAWLFCGQLGDGSVTAKSPSTNWSDVGQLERSASLPASRASSPLPAQTVLGPFRMAGLLDSQWPIAEVLEEVERSSLEPEILRSNEARRLSWNAVLRGRGSAMVEALAVVDGAEDDSEAKAVGLAMAADALTCHALTRGRLSARRGLTMILDWLGPLNASLSVHSGWPLFALLSRIRKANGLPAIESAMVVSWSSEEAAHLGGNFAETMARHIFGAVDGAVVKADVECADVWIFREHPPVNFGGVAIFVDGETHWKNSGIHNFPAYDLGIYLGPQDHGMAFGDRFFYAPFASTSFAQRKDAAMEQLLHGDRLAIWDNKTKFAAYLSHNCASESRERFYLALLRAASAFGLEVEALSRCNGSGVPRELGRRRERYSSNFYDDAVEIYKPYKFVIAMENRVAPGYVTEKIVNAFLAGAIPIYYGDSAARSIFNPASFIDLDDFNDFGEAAKTVVEIALDESSARKYVEEPVFSTTNGSYPFSWHAVASEAFPNGGLAGDVRGRVARLLEQAGSEGNVLARAFGEDAYMSFMKGPVEG
ncbi:Alpha (1,3) fucosyltransferase [Perkinsus chesapeaki]|uniref:Fucosyltransferase n=1 Tax=Perkinsus chesapeaki TaxID=330153 RepID=A0A7J6MYH5_PERCH|nr:Alpha (1,3) fucosyltransferase [Perkinsus chesapeaki]